jgi:hypothetical protein
MPRVSGGNYCAHCRTKVTDLSDVTAAQAAQILKRQKGEMCVSYLADDRNQLWFRGTRHGQVAVVLATFLAACEPSDAKQQPRPAAAVDSSSEVSVKPSAESVGDAARSTRTRGNGSNSAEALPAGHNESESECESSEGLGANNAEPPAPPKKGQSVTKPHRVMGKIRRDPGGCPAEDPMCGTL